MKRTACLLAAAALATALPCHAQQEDEATARLRDALRNTMLQLRDAQGQIAGLQAKDIANTREITALKAEVKSLTEQALAERNASANTIAELNEKLADRNATISAHEAALAKWRKDFGDAIARARKAEAESTKKTGEIQDLERLAEDQRAQNVLMYRTGMEVLDRYDKFWFGDALLAREPFVGATRVKLQNLAQDGHDKLLAARIQNEESPASKRRKPSRGAESEASPTPGTTPDTTPEATPPAAPETAPNANPENAPANTTPAATAPTPKPPRKAPPAKKPAKAKADGDRTAWPAARPASSP
jgi:cell division septation protein DedD